MVQLRIHEILEEQQKSPYWLCHKMNMCYRNFSNLVNNKTVSVRFDTLAKLSEILEVPVGDLFIEIEDDTKDA